METRCVLPDDPDDTSSRYIEAAVNSLLIRCLYLPNGNPAPSSKFDYKLRWFNRLKSYAAELLKIRFRLYWLVTIMLCQLNWMFISRNVGLTMLFRPEVRAAYHRLAAQSCTDALRKLYPDERIYTFWKYLRNAFGRDAGLRIDRFLLSPVVVKRLVSGGVAEKSAVGKRQRSCTRLDNTKQYVTARW